MVSAQLLSHEDAFVNSELLKERAKLGEKELYGFAVDGKRFKLIKESDSFLDKIWFSFLNFFSFIQSDGKAIAELTEYTKNHTERESYKNWPEEKDEEISKLAIKRLFQKAKRATITLPPKEDESLKSELEKKEGEISDLKKEVEELKAKVAASDESGKIAELEAKIEELEAKIEELKKRNSSIEELEEKINKLTRDILSKENKLTEAIKRKNHYKAKLKTEQEELQKEREERSVTEAAWSALTQELDPQKYITDKEEYLETARKGLHRALFGKKKRKSTSANLNQHVKEKEKAVKS